MAFILEDEVDYEHSPSREHIPYLRGVLGVHVIHLPSPAFPSPNSDLEGSTINTARAKNGRSHAENLMRAKMLRVSQKNLCQFRFLLWIDPPELEVLAKGSQSLEGFPSVDPQSILERKKKSNLKKPSKCIQEKCGQVKMVVGEDLAISDIANFNGKLLIVRFSGKSLGIQALQNWMAQVWSPLLGYALEAHVLSKGWNSFLCKSEVDSEKLLNNSWSWGSSGLVLKPWTVDFDPECEPVSQMKVWAIFPGLPLDFWTREALEVIGDKIGSFVGLEPNLASKKDRRWAWIQWRLTSGKVWLEALT
jgi:hypothetical protein